MNRRRTLLLTAGIAGALLIALAGVWWFVLRSNAPAPVSLDEAIGVVTTEASTGDGGATTSTASTTVADVEGDWAVSEGSGSFAGYRVREELARIGVTTAAGRTEDVMASMTISGDTVTAVDVTVNTQTLRSDEDRRDQAIRTQALETASFPTASFTLTSPIALPATASDGDAFSATAVGDLQLHGVTNSVELTIEAQLVDGVIAVVGSTQIVFADYDIDPPVAPILLSVDEVGEMEFQLLFTRG